MKHILESKFSVAGISKFSRTNNSLGNVGFQQIDEYGTEMKLKINKFWVKKKIRILSDNSSFLLEPSDFKHNNVDYDSVEKMEYEMNTDEESVLVKRVITQDGDYDESEVEEGPRFSRSKAKNRSTSSISK